MVNRSSEWSPNIRDRAVEMENWSSGRRPYIGDRTAEMENWSSERRPNISYRRMEMVNRIHFPQLVPQAGSRVPAARTVLATTALFWEFQNPNII